MILPEYTKEGDLPTGIHRASMSEVLARLGTGSLRRRGLANRLERVYELAASTGQVHRFVVFGSFVTSKEEPNDGIIEIIGR